MTTNSLVIQLFLLLGSSIPLNSKAQPSPASPAASTEVTLESCPGDVKQLAYRAAVRGYTFRAASVKGDGVCTIDETELILVLSATAKDDLACDFELFTPPDGRKFSGQRIAIKAGPGANTRYIQRGPDPRQGFLFTLDAKKGQTRQFRVVGIDVPPIGNKCSGSITEGSVQ